MFWVVCKHEININFPCSICAFKARKNRISSKQNLPETSQYVARDNSSLFFKNFNLDKKKFLLSR